MLWMTNARVFAATGRPAQPGRAILVDNGLIAAVDRAGAVPGGAQVIDLAGRTVLPGLVDAHAHLFGTPPTPEEGAEPLWPGATAPFLATGLREALRRGFTTLRDVGSYGDEVVAVGVEVGADPLHPAAPRRTTCHFSSGRGNGSCCTHRAALRFPHKEIQRYFKVEDATCSGGMPVALGAASCLVHTGEGRSRP